MATCDCCGNVVFSFNVHHTLNNSISICDDCIFKLRLKNDGLVNRTISDLNIIESVEKQIHQKVERRVDFFIWGKTKEAVNDFKEEDLKPLLKEKVFLTKLCKRVDESMEYFRLHTTMLRYHNAVINSRYNTRFTKKEIQEMLHIKDSHFSKFNKENKTSERGTKYYTAKEIAELIDIGKNTIARSYKYDGSI